jgi:hypothetical protein
MALGSISIISTQQRSKNGNTRISISPAAALFGGSIIRTGTSLHPSASHAASRRSPAISAVRANHDGMQQTDLGNTSSKRIMSPRPRRWRMPMMMSAIRRVFMGIQSADQIS